GSLQEQAYALHPQVGRTADKCAAMPLICCEDNGLRHLAVAASEVNFCWKARRDEPGREGTLQHEERDRIGQGRLQTLPKNMLHLKPYRFSPRAVGNVVSCGTASMPPNRRVT